MAIDWSKVPEGAEYYANKAYWKCNKIACGYLVLVDGVWINAETTATFAHSPFFYNDVQSKADHIVEVNKKIWPETDERISAIAQNGNTGEHYQSDQPKTAVEFLNACAAVQSERGKQYDASGTGERSFAAAASAFNAATGKSLTGSDVCLLLTMVKLVRQYSSPNRLHQDSLLDGVSYLSLWAEELSKELTK